MHGATATIAPSQARVSVSGQPVANITAVTTVAGCPFTVPGPKPQPCVLAKWLMPSARVLVAGQPAALVTGPGPAPGICQSAEQIPQGAPIIGNVQTRVIGS
jgi:hypothetical protein